MEAEAKGMRKLLNSRSLANVRNWPCAVSGRRYPGKLLLGPMEVENMRLNATGGSKAPPVAGLVMLCLTMSWPSSAPS